MKLHIVGSSYVASTRATPCPMETEALTLTVCRKADLMSTNSVRCTLLIWQPAPKMIASQNSTAALKHNFLRQTINTLLTVVNLQTAVKKEARKITPNNQPSSKGFRTSSCDFKWSVVQNTTFNCYPAGGSSSAYVTTFHITTYYDCFSGEILVS